MNRFGCFFSNQIDIIFSWCHISYCEMAQGLGPFGYKTFWAPIGGSFGYGVMGILGRIYLTF